MEEKNWLDVFNNQLWLKQIQEANKYSEKFGLILSKEDTQILITEKTNTLKKERRIEFGKSVIPQIIYAFCDSDFVFQNNYLDTLIRLQEIFFLYKNEMQDEITDGELINFMRKQFDDVCYGDLDYLEITCLKIFAEAIRTGYNEYQVTQGKGAFQKVDIVQRWDRGLYLQTLKDLFWR